MTRLFERCRTLVSRIQALIYPRLCIVCQTPFHFGDGSTAGKRSLCPSCTAEWQAARDVLCPMCAKPVMLCRCVTLGDGTVPLYSLLPYRPKKDRDAVSRFLLSRKMRMHPAAEDFLAGQVSALCRCAVTEIGGAQDDWVLCYPPRSHKKRREVGHDQSEELAKRLAHLTGVPMIPCLRRLSGADTAQKTLGAKDRVENAEDSYRFDDRYAEDLRGKRVMLIDDIATTGATLSVCASLLRQAGAEAVIAVTAARTVHP